MSELKAVHAFDVYEEYTKTGDDEQAQVYLKSEADKVIANQKRARCLAMASYWVTVSYQCADDKHRRSAEMHHRKWLEIANKFKDKEAK